MRKFFKGFVYAFNGLFIFFKNERNGRIQLCMAIAVAIAGWRLDASQKEWLVLLLCIAAVLSLEMLNSAIEKLCNLLQPEFDPTVKAIKDIAAAAVLWTAIISAVIGVFIFWPKVMGRL